MLEEIAPHCKQHPTATVFFPSIRNSIEREKLNMHFDLGRGMIVAGNATFNMTDILTVVKCESIELDFHSGFTIKDKSMMKTTKLNLGKRGSFSMANLSGVTVNGTILLQERVAVPVVLDSELQTAGNFTSHSASKVELSWYSKIVGNDTVDINVGVNAVLNSTFELGGAFSLDENGSLTVTNATRFRSYGSVKVENCTFVNVSDYSRMKVGRFQIRPQTSQGN